MVYHIVGGIVNTFNCPCGWTMQGNPNNMNTIIRLHGKKCDKNITYNRKKENFIVPTTIKVPKSELSTTKVKINHTDGSFQVKSCYDR